MRATRAKGDVDAAVSVVPVKGVFHFVAIAPLFAVGLSGADF